MCVRVRARGCVCVCMRECVCVCVCVCVTREALVSASKRFVRLASCFGLTVSLPKTKGLAVGPTLSEDDVSPVSVDGGQIEMVHKFTYLGSKLSYDGEITPEVSCRIARASKAFGCLREPVFLNHTLSTDTKRVVYKAVVVSILLYGAETWTLKAPDVRRLNSFHNRCVRNILGMTRWRVALLLGDYLGSLACIGQLQILF